jgi:GT2 family glycosyltransferase
LSAALSLIVPLFNHLQHSQEMLASLRASLQGVEGWEVVLVDDGSTDDTGDWLQSLAGLPNLRTLRHQRNRGYAAAINTGVAASRGSVLALLNSDLLFSPGWLAPMQAALGPRAARVGIVGNLQHRVGDGRLDHAGIGLSPGGQFEHIGTPPAQPRSEVLAVTGACVLLHRQVFDRVGGLDTGYVNGAEDVDLCLKLRRAGLRVVLAGDSAVRHHVSLSRGRAPGQNEANSRRLFSRWRPEIRRELAAVWRRRLAGAGATAGHPWLDGALTPEALTAPQAMAGLVAEQMLLRQEARWAREHGAIGDAGAVHPKVIDIQGFGSAEAGGSLRLLNVGALRFTAPPVARNVFACGRVGPGRAPVELELEVNGVQCRRFTLAAPGSLNIGIAQPLLWPGRVQTLRVRRLGGDEGAAGGAEVVITHLVVDDAVVGLG